MRSYGRRYGFFDPLNLAMNIIGRDESAVLVSDNHGHQANTAAVKKLFGFVEDFKPDRIFHLGDNRDLSSIRKGAAPGEACQSMLEDINAGKEFIEKLRPNVFINGNHDVRMDELAESGNGIASDFAKRRIAEWDQLYKSLTIDVLPYHPSKGIYQ